MNAAVPRRLARVVAKLMAKAPTDRPPSAEKAREMLLPFATDPTTTPRPTIRDAVIAADSPETYPELWTDDSDGEGGATHEPNSAGSLPLLYMPPDDEPEPSGLSVKQWLLIAGGILWLVLIILLLVVWLR